MNVVIRDAGVLEGLSPLLVATYLRSHGWLQTGLIEDKGAIWTFVTPEETEFEVLLPLRHDLRDFVHRMAEVLEVLAVCEGRSQMDVLRDLTAVTNDVVRVSLSGTAFEDATVPLQTASVLLNRTRQLIYAAISAVVSTRLTLPLAQLPPHAGEYLQTVRLGQTERGSFTLTVLSPVPPAFQVNGATLPDESLPSGRRVTRTLAHALDATQRALALASASGRIEPFREAIDRGASPPLYDALAGMFDDHDARRVELRSSWSAARPEPPTTPTMTVFTADAAPALREAARLLGPGRSRQGTVEVEGIVLDRRTHEQRGMVTVTVAGIVDRELRKVIVETGLDDDRRLDMAARSHALARFRGELRREGPQYVLHRAELLSVRDADL